MGSVVLLLGIGPPEPDPLVGALLELPGGPLEDVLTALLLGAA